MDDENVDLELLQTNSSDLNVMSDDFLSMLNTDCKTSDIDEFNSWFQDNIIPDVNATASERLSDSLCTDSGVETNHNDLFQSESDLTSQYYSSYDDITSENGERFIDGNYIAPFRIEEPTYNDESHHAYTNGTLVSDKDQYITLVPEKSAVPSSESENTSDYFVKETYYQDDSGNTFVEQEYIQKQDISDQKHSIKLGNAGSKRPRTSPASEILKKNISYTKEHVPQKTVFRQADTQLPKAPTSVNSRVLGYSKPLQASANSRVLGYVKPLHVKSEANAKPRLHCTQNPQTDAQVNQKARIFIPNKGQRNLQKVGSITASHPNKISSNTSPQHVVSTSTQRVVYVSSRVRGGKPPRLVPHQSLVSNHPQSNAPRSNALQSNPPQSNLTKSNPPQSNFPSKPPPENPPLKDERLSPTSTVINEWEQSINKPSAVVGSSITFNNGRVQIHKGPVQVKSALPNPSALQQKVPKVKSLEVSNQVNKTEVARMPLLNQVKGDLNHKINRSLGKATTNKEVNHISIQGKPGLVNLKKDEQPVNLKIPKPVNCTKPIIKEAPSIVKDEGEEEEEPEEKRTNHNAVERKYRYSINDKIMELKEMLVPKDTKVQKSGVLRKAIEHISTLESTISKLKLDNIQLKKKQEILEKNNHVLTLKLGEQGSNVVYLDKTPDLIEPPGLYKEGKQTDLSTVDDSSGESPRKSPPYTYQHSLPDSPESLRQSDSETRHARSNSASSGGYSSTEETHRVKKPRYMENSAVYHRDQRTIPMLCMVFMFGLFIPSILPKESIASSTFGRSLLSVSQSYDYISPLIQIGMVVLAFLISTTLSYLFFVIKSKIVIKDETIFKTRLETIKQLIKKGDENAAQSDLEYLLCNAGVRVFHNKLSYQLMVVEYILSILPHNRVVHWLCCNNSHVLSDMLLSLAHLQSSNKVKRYEDWSCLCYALQASRYNITASNVYITLSLAVNNSVAKAHFFRRGNRRDNRWISSAKDFILSKKMSDIPLGEVVSSSLELQHTQELVSRAARELILSSEGTVERKQTAATLMNQARPSLAFLRKEFPAVVKEIYWFIEVLQTYQANEDEIETLKFNETSEITSIVSTIYEMTQGPDDVTEIEICDVIDRLNEIADPSSLQKVILCGAVDWLFGVQISRWKSTQTVSVSQKSNFKQSIQLLDSLGGNSSEYKVSLYTAVQRVMCQANPTITKKHLQNVLQPDKPTVNNLEQVLAIEVCLRYVPSLLLPSKETLLEHMQVFLRSLD